MTPRLYFLALGTVFVLAVTVYAGYQIVLGVKYLVGG